MGAYPDMTLKCNQRLLFHLVIGKEKDQLSNLLAIHTSSPDGLSWPVDFSNPSFQLAAASELFHFSEFDEKTI